MNGTLRALESELREQIQGVRLLGELPLDDLRGRLVSTVDAAATGSLGRRRFPAQAFPRILTCYLVAEGIYSYQAGAYWPNLSVRGLDQTTTGEDFEEALRRLRLETFEHVVKGERALRFICPILAHAGVPEYCVHDFFRLLVHELGRGAGDAEDMIATWRARKTSFQGIDVPVKRFLLHGGRFAIDRLERSIALIDQATTDNAITEGTRAGLPAYMVQRFLEMPPELRTYTPASRGVPRPRIRIDPWDSLGPVIELPAHGDAGAFGPWEINDGDRTWELPSEAGEVRSIRLVPATSWSAVLRPGDSSGRRFVFLGLDAQSPALFFDPADRRLIRTATELHLESVWVLSPAGTVLEETRERTPLRIIEDAPPPTGGWHGFELRHVDLEGVSSFHVARDGNSMLVRVIAPAERPHLAGAVVPCASVSGHRVYAGMPQLVLPEVAGMPLERWRIRLRDPHRTLELTAADIPSSDVGLNLDGVSHGGFPAVFELLVRGPLGLDLRDTFAVVPGLALSLPPKVVMPREDDACLTAVVDDQYAFAGGSASCSLNVPSVGDEVELEVHGPEQLHVIVAVAVPRLLWAVARSDNPAVAYACDVVSLGADEIEEGKVQHVSVRTRKTGVPVSLALVAGHAILQCTNSFITAGDDGRWAFPLGQFRDSIRASGARELCLRLEIAGQSVDVAHLTAAVEVSQIRAKSTSDNDRSIVELSFDEKRVLRNREVRLWSMERPWEEPFCAPIPDEVQGQALIAVRGGLVPGRYLVEIAIMDPWIGAKRPRRGAPNTAEILVGDALGFAKERGESAETVLESLFLTGERTRSLSAAEIAGLCAPGLKTLFFCVEDGQDIVSSRGFLGVASLLAEGPEALPAAIAECTRGTRVAGETVLLASIGMAHLLALAGDLELPHDAMREVWQASPILAAALDLPSRTKHSDAASRCEEFLGIAVGDELPAGYACTQNDIGAAEVVLRERREYCQLIPGKWLQLDERVLAYFEWILGCQERGRDFGWSWWQDHCDILGDAALLPAAEAALIEARLAPKGTEAWAGLPAVTLAAALHATRGTGMRERAVRTLLSAIPFASRLVTRDLILARLLTVNQGATRECTH